MAGDAIWLEVLPELSTFASDLLKGTTTASEKAGAASGAAFGKKLTEGATSEQSGIVASLEKTSKAAQAAVDRETQAIAKARAAQRDAAAKVIEAEAKLEQARASGDGAKVAAAEERLAGARERAAGAASGVEAAEKRLSSASKARNEVVDDLAKAEKELAENTGKSATEAKGSETAFGRLKGSLDETEKGAHGAAGKMALLAGAVGSTAAAAALLGEAWGQNLDLSRGTAKATAQLNLTAEESERVGKVAGQLYAAGFGESASDMTAATASVVSSIGGMREASAEELAKMTGQMKGIADTFDMDVARVAQVTGQMVKAGLAKDAQEGADLLAATFQKVPENVREDVLDAVDEYAPFMEQLGIVGTSAMEVLATGAEKGMFGIDKAGDAVKEFTIRATDMSKSTSGAYDLIGISQKEMTDALLAGGDEANRAFNQIMEGLLGVEDPAAQAQAAIALFGTPLEDLNTGEIPQFLEGLYYSASNMDDVAGSAQGVADNVSSVSDPMESLKRSLAGTVSEGLQPFVGPAQQIAEWAKENPGAMQAVVIVLGVLAGALGVAAVAQWVMNSAMLASPTTWIILGIGLLIGALVLLVQNWDTVVKFLKGTFGPILRDVQAWFGDVGRKAGELWGGLVSGAEGMAKGVGRFFDDLKAKAMIPVKWVADNVVNPLLGGVEKVGNFFGLKLSLPRLNFSDGGTLPQAGGANRGRQVALATGGVMPGYTPGRDVHRFYSPTGGLLDLSGGEAVMRPEVTATLGTSWVDGMNAAARAGGQAGVRQFLHEQGFHAGGTVALPSMAQRFQTGGIVANASQGFRGYDPKALAMIQAWARATGRTWSMTGIGGARDYQTQKAAYQRYLAGTGPLAANPDRGGPHMMPAIAMDLSPRPGEIASARALLGRFGLGLPVRGEPWHVQYLAGRSGGGQTDGGGIDIVGMLTSSIGKLLNVSGAGVFGDILNAVPGTLIKGAGDWLKSTLGFDSGGMLPAGMTVAVNATGRPERVLTDPQWDALKRAGDIGMRAAANPTRPEDIRRALEGMRMRVDLDNGDVWFEDQAGRRDRRESRRRDARQGVTV